MTAKAASPIIKWCGGKRQLLPTLLPLFPQKIGTYYEPFIGGGAVFWALAAEGRFQQATVNDWNPEIANLYRTVRDHVEPLIVTLLLLSCEYTDDRKGAYSRVRDGDRSEWFQSHHKLPDGFNDVADAARTIFLNRTGFNGLYRVNRAGKFNVPIGDYKNPKILDEDNLRACSEVLRTKGVAITQGDFSKACEDAQAGDLVYFDPPYVPVSATSNFASYTSEGFTLDDQKRLADLFRTLVKRGVRCVLSNSDTDVIRELYQDFEILTVPAKRAINSKVSKRGPVNEVVVTSVLQDCLTPTDDAPDYMPGGDLPSDIDRVAAFDAWYEAAGRPWKGVKDIP